jgi:RNA polymerase subunit RPABC4/transcription elongation factor Spt4
MKFFAIYFCVVWIALIIWVARDILQRSNNKFLQVFCILIMILFTPFGVFLYLIIRPGKNVYENLAGEIEENLEILQDLIHERIGHNTMTDIYCPSCQHSVESDYMVCPNCSENLKHTCHECHKEVRENWAVCPYCQSKQKKKKKKKKEKKTD